MLALITNVYSLNWYQHWENAIQYCDKKNYEAAEQEFNLAIALLEESKEDMHPHVYVDRARLYCLQDRYTEALIDLNKALFSEHLKEGDRCRGLITRIFVCSNLSMDEQVLADYTSFKSLSGFVE